MFSGFNLSLNTNSCMELFEWDFEKYKKKGEEHLNSRIQCFNDELEELIRRNTINGSQLQKFCFPIIEADIFLSHSHKDHDLANALAGWIYDKFDLKVFIDSNVWEYSGNLLEELNSHYSNRQESDDGNDVLYDYKSCCKVSEHVNTMLSAALHKMIDKAECVILLNTDSSVRVFEDDSFAETYSPWIYSEIICTQIVRKKPLLCYREYDWSGSFFESQINTDGAMDIAYNLPIKHLTDISADDLKKWLENYEKDLIKGDYDGYALDELYCFTHKKHVEITKKMCRLADPIKIEKIKEILSGESDGFEDLIVYITG